MLDVVIVGGGVSGLAAAAEASNKGLSVAVLEARDLPGGRCGAGQLASVLKPDQDLVGRAGDKADQALLENAVASATTNNHQENGSRHQSSGGKDHEENAAADAARAGLGAGYVDATHRRVLRWLAAVGLGVKPVADDGRSLLEATPGLLRRLVADIPLGQGPLALIASARLLNRLEASAARLPSSDLSSLSNDECLAALDAFTVRDFTESSSGGNEEASALVQLALQPVFGSKASEISLAWALVYARAAGSLSRLLAVRNGAQELKVDHARGFGELATRMAASLEPGVLRVSSPVKAIQRKDEGSVNITIESADGAGETILQAKHCIIAVQPTMYSEIKFEPPLEETKMRFGEAMRRCSGSFVKIRVAYSEAWWRPRFSGQVLSCRGPMTYFLDDCRRGGDPEPFALVGFVVSHDDVENFQKLGGLENQRQAVAEQIQRYFKDKRALEPISVRMVDWTQEKWNKGCVNAMPPGHFDVWKSSRTTHMDGRIHFAGAETATAWIGYVDGAIQAGERAVHEVCAAIRKEDPNHPVKFDGKPFCEEEPKPQGHPNVHEVKNMRPYLERLLFGKIIRPEDMKNKL